MRILRCLPYILIALLTLGFGLREFNWRQNLLEWEAEAAAQAERVSQLDTRLQQNRAEYEALQARLQQAEQTLADQTALTEQRDQQVRLWQGRTANLETELQQRANERDEFRETLRSERAEWLQRERDRRNQENNEIADLQQALNEAQEALAQSERRLSPPVAFAETQLHAQSSGRRMLALSRPADYPYQRNALVMLRDPVQRWTAAQVRDATADYLLIELFDRIEFGDTLVKAEKLIMVWPTES